MKRRELLQKLAAGLAFVGLAPLAAQAKKPGRLEIKVGASNGMFLDTSTSQQRISDQAIRVFVTLTNTRSGKIEILNAQGNFLAPDGAVLQKCPPQSLTLDSRASDSIVFYYNNSEGLYGFRFDGQLQYLIDGEMTAVPIVFEDTQRSGQPINY